jgi:3-hydroxyacyl-[acyl-carrier-protein] dehydratase
MSNSFPGHAVLEQLENCLMISFSVPESYAFFEGHFPENPLVPAVVQIGWIISGIAKLTGTDPGNYHLSRFKFLTPIRPNELVRIQVTGDGSSFRCEVCVDGQTCCKGTVLLESHG